MSGQMLACVVRAALRQMLLCSMYSSSKAVKLQLLYPDKGLEGLRVQQVLQSLNSNQQIQL
jgi:hypothetical protein